MKKERKEERKIQMYKNEMWESIGRKNKKQLNKDRKKQRNARNEKPK